jgi:hypothetical protein
MSEQTTLLPCPFCGGKPYHHRAVNGANTAHLGCAASGFEFKCAHYQGEEPSKDLSAAWNKRSYP